MAKKIKVIKCPQCGNSKPILISEDRYRCDKCSTEFFLDNDDININVNHNYGSKGNNTSNSKGIWIAVVVIILSLLFMFRLCGNESKKPVSKTRTTVRTTPKRKVVEQKKYIHTMLLSANGQGVAFYFDNVKKDSLSSVNSLTPIQAVFYDIASSKIIKEQLIPSITGTVLKVKHRSFISDSTDYVIINDQLIYKIDTKNYLFTDITSEICERKPALNAGITSAHFVDENKGEGFRLFTNLGKELYYFTASDMLYTQKAFDYTVQGKVKTLLPGAKDQVYYLFLNKESVYSSNVAQLLEVKYKFNNGGPEKKMMEYTERNKKYFEDYRIVSCEPITEERVYFSPQIIYFDQRNILITYRPTLAEDADYNLQLLDPKGAIVWTTPFKQELKSLYTVRINDGFMLQTSETTFLRVNEQGAVIQDYKLPL